ncbi:MAG: S8/S53 family peptidase [Myxococcota bacterium]
MNARLTPRPEVFAVLLLFGGCTENDTRAGVARTAAGLTFSAFPDPSYLCAPRRMVTRSPSSTCLAVTGWQTEPVFPGATELELRNYCIYRYTGLGDPTAANIAALPGEPTPDCLVAHPLATPSFFSTVRDAFHTQIELPTLEQQPGLPAPEKTWIAMIDTSPASKVSDGRAVAAPDMHGYVLARILREVGCPNNPAAACTVHVHHELALPWIFDGTTWISSSAGGHFGYQTDVARAVNRAVEAWKTSTESRLVVNLSIGWLDTYGGRDPGKHAASDTTYAAIAKARCLGAIVFAAAGNKSGGLVHTEGPLVPALWASHRAPSPAECSRYSGTNAIPSPGWGLLEAVGGVDPSDRPLANARPNSTPRLVAPGFMGTADGLTHEDLTLSGTSVSTAVAAVAAAIAWAYAPDASASEVMQALYASGARLEESTSDVFCEGSCPRAHRVSVCSTLEYMCFHDGVSRPGCVPQHCARRQPYVPAFAALTESMFAPAEAVFSASTMKPQPGEALPGDCGAAQFLRPAEATGVSAAPCPDRQYYRGSAHPDVVPQPSGNACPQCRFTQNALALSVTVELDSARLPDGLQDPSVVVQTGTTSQRFAVHEIPGLSTLTGDVAYRVNDLPLSTPPDRVTIVGRTATGESLEAALAPATP